MNRAGWTYLLVVAALITGYLIVIGLVWHSAGCSTVTPC